MADALVSTPVAVVAGIAAIGLLGIAGGKIKKEEKPDIIPLMGVMGAFIFAAQMINFTIPGTGSSGHIVGGILLAALLGPWAGFITLSSVIIIQCLLFADGGLMALGCNVLNMCACTTLVAYPLFFRPLAKFPAPAWRIFVISVLACVAGLELGAAMVVLETELSHITALPSGAFLVLMSLIHLAIGIGEGLATGCVLVYIQKTQPNLLSNVSSVAAVDHKRRRRGLIIFASGALILGGVLYLFASTNPDGLEWSIMKLTGSTELPSSADSVAETVSEIQSTTSILPDYGNSLSGIIGSVIVLIGAYIVGTVLLRRK